MFYRQVFACTVGLVLATGTGFPQAIPSAMTPEQLVNAALTRNLDYLAVQQRVTETQGLLRQAGVRPVPTLEFDAASGKPLGTPGEEEFTAGYFYTFETGGKRNKRLTVAEKALALANAEILERRREITFEVKTKYANAVAEALKVDALQELVKTNRQYTVLTKARVDEGDAAPLEGQLLLTELNRTLAQQAVTEGKSRSALLDLRALVSLPPTEPFGIGKALVAPALASQDAREQQALALRNRPDLKTLILLEEQSESETALAEAESKPNLTLSARYSHRTSAFDQFGLSSQGVVVPLRDRDDILAFGVAVPLATRRRNQGTIEASLARQTGARQRREYLQSIIPIQVDAAFQKWQAAQRAVDIFGSGVIDQSEKNVDVMRQAYTLGQLRLLDVLNEQRRLIDTKFAFIDAQAELFRAWAELEQAVGGEVQ
jgi:outer membrane protein, heavy metal efflux system